jgi:hypothetical protein
MLSRLPVLLILALLVAVARPYAQVADSPVSALANSSDLIVTGRVSGLAAQSDGSSIYTYVSVQVAEVLKGRLADSAIVLKQLGGTLPDLGLYLGTCAWSAAVATPPRDCSSAKGRR